MNRPVQPVVVVTLTLEQRACILRAVRTRRIELEQEIERLVEVAIPTPETRTHAIQCRVELECLQNGAKALWGDP